MEYFFSIIIVGAACFLLGSIPFGLVFAKSFCGLDPRDAGSRNVGATNVARLCGRKWGALTLLCDLLKGFLPVLLLTASGSNLQNLVYPAALAVILGHMHSFFLDFKGGKGVATTVGVFLALAPWHLVLAGVACLAAIKKSGYVSVGSLALVTLLPLFLLFSARFGDALFALVVAGFVVYAHKENIRRLLRGEEKPWSRAN